MGNLLVVAILLLASVKPAAAESGVCALVKRHYASSASVTADFEQSIYWSVREKTSKNRGTIIMAPGNRFRIDLTNETYVGDGQVYWQYNRNSNQVVIRDFGELDPAARPSQLLTTFLNDYRFSETGQKGSVVTLSWKGDGTETGDYRSIVIDVQKDRGIVTSIVATDKNMNVHTYRFTKTVFGKALPANTFTFEAPPHANVIDHRK